MTRWVWVQDQGGCSNLIFILVSDFCPNLYSVNSDIICQSRDGFRWVYMRTDFFAISKSTSFECEHDYPFPKMYFCPFLEAPINYYSVLLIWVLPTYCALFACALLIVNVEEKGSIDNKTIVVSKMKLSYRIEIFFFYRIRELRLDGSNP